ncbi:MAG: 50S ribosomal protein L4 [Magnetococcales bacterium]|nr:50S ribosomal protein L4 [Magnetococcales bacterium]
MIEHPLKDANNQELRQVSLPDETFGRPVRADLLARAVQYQLAKRRAGCASTKTRSDVRGGGKKPYRQKGTGNARQGTIRAPQWRTGGVVFGPHPHSHATKLPKQVRRLALQTALSAKREDGDLILIDKLELTEIRTKSMRAVLGNLGAERSALIVIPVEDHNLQLSARNLPGISVIRVEGVNVYDLLRHEKVIITEAALGKLEERLA